VNSWWRDRRETLAIAIVISVLVHSLLLLAAVYVDIRLGSTPLEALLAKRGPVEVELETEAVRPPRVELPRASAPARSRVKPAAAQLPEPKRAKPEPEKPEPTQQPEPEAKQETKVELVELPKQRMKMVELSTPESDSPPDNARFLSDKNRRVAEETRAQHTNLERDHPRPAPSSERGGPSAEKQPGGREQRIAETREQRARAGERGAPRSKQPREVSPLLAMRRAGAPGKQSDEPPHAGPRATSPEGVFPRSEGRQRQRTLAGQDGEGGRAKRSRPGIRVLASRTPLREDRIALKLDHRSLDRIDGKAAERARELARLSPSVHRGSFQKKWERVRAALENFIPEVRPGNQTALGTRASPFALYIARMHRKIHKLWGFGFLVDLDAKPDSHAMNDMQLWTMVEVVIAPSGAVEKSSVVRPSGNLPFDVAAIDAVLSASPYEGTPRAIRSANGRVYLHWRFHRDQRQCGTFGVDPFILSTPPKGLIDNPHGEVKGDAAGPARELRRLHRAPAARARTAPAPAGAARAASVPRAASPAPRGTSTAKGAARPADPRDPQAGAAAKRFLAAFSAGKTAAMAAGCGLPFSALGRKVATSRGELERMFLDLVREAGGRGTAAPRLLTPMQARAQGALPEGVEHGSGQLVARTSLGGAPATLVLAKDKAGRWLVVGLNHGR
jgi:TonB family protein